MGPLIYIFGQFRPSDAIPPDPVTSFLPLYFVKSKRSCWYRYQIEGVGTPFFKNYDFQVAIDTNFGGGGVNLPQKVKSWVFGLWVGIINVDPPPVLIQFIIFKTICSGCTLFLSGLFICYRTLTSYILQFQFFQQL